MAFDGNRDSTFAEEAGPSLEDFLSLDPSHLPFLQERSAPTDDALRFQIFADEWNSIEHLQQLRSSVLQLVDSLTSGFIWHREPFELSVAVPPEGDLEPHLYGDQVIGDSISDEWFVCFLLFSITSTFDGLTARITDNDGEFLLIEAATAIPPLLSPANSDHRVWIRSGEVHLVMPGCMVNRARTPRTLGSGSILLPEGLSAVREGDGCTVADEGVQRLIRRRVEVYPDKAQAEMHRVRCFLPVKAALVFQDSPGLVAAAVHAYCSGDPVNKRHGVRMSRLLSASIHPSLGSKADRAEGAGSQFIEMRITFTRHLYAQLHHAAAVPSKAFPQGWGPSGNTLSPAYRAKAAQLGKKLSMGLEAAYQECAENCTRRTKGDLRSSVSPHAWKKFMDALERNGFFEGELEGSKRYREKAAMAERFARERVLLIDGGGEFGESAGAQRGSRPCTVHEVIDRAIENAVDEDYVFQAPTEEDDEEHWLEVSEADLNEVLKEYLHGEAEPEASDRGQSGEYSDLDRHDEESPMSLKSSDNVDRVKRDLSSTCRGTTASEGGQAGFEDAVNELDDIVTGMNTFIEDSRAGVDGAEVEPVGGDVRFDVDKFMSLLNGEDLMSVLDGAAAEGDALADMQGSTQDFVLHSSEEEEEEDGEDSDYLTQRMPESAMSQGLGPKTVSVDTHRASSGVLNGTHVTENHSRREKIARNPNIQTSSVLESSGEQVRRRDGGDEKDDSDGTESLIKHYMAAMEAELDSSAMGQSFEKARNSISETQTLTRTEMKHLEMIGPLDQITEDEQRGPAAAVGSDAPTKSSAEVADDVRPVDIDMNLVMSLLESSASQGGLSGPATNILGSMGLKLPSMPPVSPGAQRGEEAGSTGSTEEIKAKKKR
ncbi:unnamed protein product [Ascophyllum nodosum]